MADPTPDPVAELRRANAELTAARRAALNVLEDALLARDALRASEEKYRTLFESMDEGFLVHEMVRDETGRAIDFRLVEVNPAFTRMTGLGNEVVGRLNSESLPNTERVWLDTFDRVARTGTPERVEEYHRDTDRWYTVHVSRAGGDDRRVAVVFDDVTARKRAELALKASGERQAFLLRLSDALRPVADPVAVQAEACRVLGEYLGVDRAYYVEIDEAAGTATVRRDYLRGTSPSMAAVYRLADYGWSLPVMRAGTTIVFADVAQTDLVPPADRPALTRIQIVAHVAVPVVKAGTLVGCFCVTEPVPRAWTAAEVELVRETAERTWAAVEQAKAEAALRESRAFHELIADLGSDWWFSARIDPDGTAVTEAVGGGFTRLLGYTPDELMAAGGWAVLVHPDDRPEADRQMARLLAGETIEGELRHVARGGRVTWSHYRTRPETDPAGRVARVYGVARDVTDRKRAEAAVRESEERFRGLAEAVPQIVWSSTDDTVDYFNSRWWEYTGLDPATGLGGAWHAVVHPDDRAAAVARSGHSGATGADYEIEYRLRRADGAYRWHIGRATRVPALGRWFGTATDVHDLRTALDALRERDEQLSLVQRSAKLGVSSLDLATGVGVTTPEWRDVVGFPDPPAPQDFATLLRLVHPDDRDRVRALHEGSAPDRGLEYEFRVVHPARGERWVFSRSVYQPAADGRPGRLVGMALDVTDRHRAEESLRASEERLRLALAAARMGTWTLDLDTGTQTRDAHLNRLLGLDPVETAQPFDEFFAHIHPEDRAGVRAAFAAAARGERPLATEFRVVRPDGAVRWLRDQGDVFGPAGRAGPRMTGACVDVTDRRAAEEALRRSEERVRLILESAADFAIFTVGPDRTVTTWTSGAAAVFGYTEAEIAGRSSDLLFTPEDRAAGAPEAEAETARRDGRAADERWHLRKDGVRFYAAGVLTPLGDPDRGFVKVARDLTDRKRMEDELRAARDQLERRVAERTADLAGAIDSLEREMARRRELAGRLATAQENERRRVARELHDSVGQLLSGLGLAVQAVSAAGPLPPAASDKLTEVRRLADAAGREAHALAVRLRPTSLDDLGLEAAVGQLVADWAARTQVPADFQAVGFGAGRLPAEVETALYRVVQEALTNVTRHARASAVSVVLSRAGGEVRAAVEDDGIGFDPDAPGRGRLGLVGMRERMALVGGGLDVESAPGGGTTVIARVPLSEA
ncbi:MAG: PAS domain S-box protein [Gemmataceae bacterium]